MKVPSPSNEDRPEYSGVGLTAALISELGLTDVMVEKVYEVMQATGTEFADAAGRLGIIRAR